MYHELIEFVLNPATPIFAAQLQDEYVTNMAVYWQLYIE